MRLLSQHGNVDIPYEQARIEHRQEEVVAIIGDREYTMGKYTSMKKSYKVMEMLRDAYVGMPVIMQNVEVADEVIEKLKKQNVICAKLPEEKSSIEYVNNTYFKFPKDNDVEV